MLSGSEKDFDDLEMTRSLLAETFPFELKYSKREFLEWQYDKAQGFHPVETNFDIGERRLGHYALIPQRYSLPGRVVTFGLSLNTAISEEAKGQGLFTKLAQQTFIKSAEQGLTAIVGVANSNSTPGFLRKLGFYLVGSLPAGILIPTKLRKSRQFRTFLPGEKTKEIEDFLNSADRSGVSRLWDDDELSRRLRAPDRKFLVHLSDDMLAISCSTVIRRVPVAVLVKVFVQKGSLRNDLASVASCAALSSSCVATIYSGFNPRVSARMRPIPDRMRPSPLNLIVKSLDPTLDSSAIAPTTFEFLDFDAY